MDGVIGKRTFYADSIGLAPPGLASNCLSIVKVAPTEARMMQVIAAIAPRDRCSCGKTGLESAERGRSLAHQSAKVRAGRRGERDHFNV